MLTEYTSILVMFDREIYIFAHIVLFSAGKALIIVNRYTPPLLLNGGSHV